MSQQTTNTDFLNEASSSVLQSIQSIYNQDIKEVKKLFHTQYASQISSETAQQLVNVLINPVREIADRGGKGWRSYLILNLCEALGGDPDILKPYTGVMELLHVGSLIVDDIQDQSILRRGGPACHLLYGEPLALNAGNSVYFLFDTMVEALPLSNLAKIRLYKTFFEVLRSGHAGQALDINGLASTAREAIKTGNFSTLRKLSIDVHRLKTGMPVVLGMIIAATVANATEEQINAVTNFGEVLGITFQVGDDIINLKGFDGNLKTKGEDIAHGKITFPMVVALENLPRNEAIELLELLLKKDNSIAHINYVLSQINKVDALQKSLAWSKELLMESWLKLDPHIPENDAKNNILQLGSFFIEKHY